MAEDGAAKILARNLNALVEAGNTNLENLVINGGAPLSAPVARPRIGATSGIGRLKSAPTPQSTSGIASPLTETARTTYPTSSTDGLFTMSVPSSLTFVDANLREVVMILAQP